MKRKNRCWLYPNRKTICITNKKLQLNATQQEYAYGWCQQKRELPHQNVGQTIIEQWGSRQYDGREGMKNQFPDSATGEPSSGPVPGLRRTSSLDHIDPTMPKNHFRTLSISVSDRTREDYAIGIIPHGTVVSSGRYSSLYSSLRRVLRISLQLRHWNRQHASLLWQTGFLLDRPTNNRSKLYQLDSLRPFRSCPL